VSRFGARAGAVLISALLAASALGCDPTSIYGPLQTQWTVQTGGSIAAKPTDYNGSVLIGSWDGFEYSFNQASGALGWKRNLGQTSGYCFGLSSPQWTLGVTSSPAIDNGFAYLGGGDANWYGLNATSGDIRFSISTGDNSSAGGDYNWSSPLIYNGVAYIGVASLCDAPLNQGRLMRVRLFNGAVENVWKVVPDGSVGGGIWTSPVVDPATNTVFVTTGTRTDSGAGQQYTESIVALNADTLAVKSFWALPANVVGDFDWGTSPTLFTDSNGRALVAAINKDGNLYAFDRNNLGAGPIWQRQVAQGGGCPQCGDGSVSNGAFDGQRLYFGGGRTTINGQAFAGSVRAFDPATGQILWEQGLPSEVIGSLTLANGLLVVPDRSGLFVLHPGSGWVFYANDLGSDIYAQAIVAGGRLFLGDVNGVFHVFTFPASPAAAQPSPSGAATAAQVRARAAAARSGAIGCAQAAGSSAVAPECRLAVAPRCTSVGRAPKTAGPFAIQRVAVRELGRGRHPPATVSFYANGACSGRPTLRLRLVRGRSTLRLRHALVVPRGSAVSMASSRAMRLRITVGLAPSRSRRGATRTPGAALMYLRGL
jgi:outer membrane protein assembly factor BamB